MDRLVNRTALFRHPNFTDRREQWLPWGWCHLYRNPFGELTRSERAELAVVDADDWCDWLAGSRRALQFIGPSGNGKTTRLLALTLRFPRASYTYIPECEPCPALPSGYPLLVDEAQRLPRDARLALAQSGLPLVLGTHRNLARPLQRLGYAVLTVRIGKQNSPELLREIANRRIFSSRLSPSINNLRIPSLSLSDACKLTRRFGSNFRKAESYLYDQFQAQRYSHGEVRFID